MGSSLSGANFPVTPAGAMTYYAEATYTGSGGGGGSGSQSFSFTGSPQTFTVPPGVTSIDIDARGAQGGGSNGGGGGLGARMMGTYAVTPGQVLTIIVGEMGLLQVGGQTQNSSGGGGGTFVYDNIPTLFVAAGGGGGKCNYTGSSPLHPDAAGLTGTSGGASSDGNLGGTGGNGGNAGLWSGSPCSGGGAGWLSAGGGAYGGASYSTWIGGPGYCAGGGGGCGGVGGFGGGGGGGNLYGGGGGGGGYSGGGGGTDPTHGGGGGSYSIGVNQNNTAGYQSGNGEVIISWGGGSQVCYSERTSLTVAPANVTPPTNVTATPSTFCPGQSVQLSGTTTGDSILWYTTPTGGVSIGSSQSGLPFTVNPTGTTTYYAEAVFGGGAGGGGSNSLVTGTVQQSALTLPYTPGSTPIGVVYNPQFSLYYASTGGSTGVPLVTFDANGVQLSSVSGNFDFRGSWWNSNTNTFEANSYGSTGYRTNDLDASGWALGSGIVSPTGQQQPNSQSQGGYDPVNDEVVFYDAGQIYRRSRATGAPIASGAITGLPAGSINNYWCSFSGVPGSEIMIFDYTNKAVRFIDRNTFAYTSSVQLAPAAPGPSSWSLGYDGNGTLWIHNGTVWTAWEVVNIGGGSGSCVSTRVPVTVTASPNPPLVSCPATQLLALNPNCSATLPDYTTMATVNQGCAGPMTVSQAPPAGTVVSGSGLITIILTATDAAGITAACNFSVNKQDTNPPSITCSGNQTLALGANCSVALPSYIANAVTSDACAGTISVTQSPAAGTLISGQAVTTITLTATDASSNTATCSFTVTTTDNAPPTITCPGNQTLSLGANCSIALPDYTTGISAIDACTGSAPITQSPAPGTILNGAGNTTVTLSATDGNNNIGTCSFTVNHTDNVPPVILCPGSQTINLNSQCSATMPDYSVNVSVTDNCGNPLLVQSPAAGSPLSGSGVVTVTLTATDAGNNTTTCSFTLTKTDNTPPTPNVSPLPGVNGECSVSVSAPQATDDCSGPITATTTDPLSYNAPGTYTINWVYSDLSGNVITQSQTVTVTPVSVAATSNSPVCSGVSLNLSANSATSGNYLWTGPNNFTSNQANASVSTPVAGNYIVTFTSSLNPNCTISDTVSVTISPLPNPVITQVGTLLSTGTYATYQWLLNGFALSGANGPTHNATANGLYSVQVTDANGCVGSSALFNVTNVSIDPILNDRLSVYPNPAKESINILLTDLGNHASAKIYNYLGQLIMTIPLAAEKTEVNLQTLAKGVYTLEVWENGERTGMVPLMKD